MDVETAERGEVMRVYAENARGSFRVGTARRLDGGAVEVLLDAVPLSGRLTVRSAPVDVAGDHPGVKGEALRATVERVLLEYNAYCLDVRDERDCIADALLAELRAELGLGEQVRS